MDERSDFQKRLSDAIDEAVAVNDSLSEGVSRLLCGQIVTEASAEVWSSDGEFSIALTFSDGSKIECPGVVYASGPLADLVRMAGGVPESPDGELDTPTAFGGGA